MPQRLKKCRRVSWQRCSGGEEFTEKKKRGQENEKRGQGKKKEETSDGGKSKNRKLKNREVGKRGKDRGKLKIGKSGIGKRGKVGGNWENSENGDLRYRDPGTAAAFGWGWEVAKEKKSGG
jgi:hypothetical protein